MTIASAVGFASPFAPKCSASKATWPWPLRAMCRNRLSPVPPKPKKAVLWERLKKRNTKF